MNIKKTPSLLLLLIGLTFNSFGQFSEEVPSISAPTSCNQPEKYPWRERPGYSDQINLCSQYNRVGIGTSLPQATFHVYGSSRLQGSLDVWDYANFFSTMFIQGDLFTSGNIYMNNNRTLTNGDVKITPSKVRIGCNDVASSNLSGNQLLQVDGTIICEEVQVQLSQDWADYVFQKNYYLRPLEIVEQFIANNKHLPGVPSAKSIKEDGLTVGEMMKIQMEKIEELTLYIIEQDKRIKKLESQLN